MKIEFGESRLQKKYKEIEQAHFCLGLPTVAWADGRRYVGRVMDVLLAGNSSSRLSSVIREKHSLAYYVFPAGESLKEAGYWAVQAGVKMNKVAEAIELTKKEILGLARTLTTTEIERTKSYITGKIKLNMDSTDYWSTVVGQKLLLEGRLIELDYEIERYRRVKNSEVIDFASQYLVEDQIRSLVVVNKDD